MDPLGRIFSRKLKEELGEMVDWSEVGEDIGRKVSEVRDEAESLMSMFHRPPVDIYRIDDELVVLIDVPGYERGDIELLAGDEGEIDELRARGQRTGPAGGEPLYEERPKSFDRKIPLPDTCRSEDVGAELEDGVLRVTLTCETEEVGKRIEIK